MSPKKILIIGQSFNKKSGGGVTITNLFKGWPKDKLAVASNANLYHDLDISVCDTYYQLGYNNKLHPFPFSMILPKIKCGIIPIEKNSTGELKELKKIKSNWFKKNIYQILATILHFIGLYNVFYKLKITSEFAAWLKEYNPDIIYTQLASLEMIRFVDEIHELTKKRIAIHIMDDWPLTINRPGILYKFWRNVIDKEFRKLIDKSSILMSIGDAMSEEYKLRYKRTFIPFHNPIDITVWKSDSVKNYAIKDKYVILYAGRIGPGIKDSIVDLANAVNEITNIHKDIYFEIQTTEVEALQKHVKLNEHVKWVAPIAYSALPAKFFAVDLLFLPQDFDEKSVKFLKYSFPTKVSEYMISGTPILVYGDNRTAIIKYAIKDKWAYVVTQNNKDTLVKAIKDLYTDISLRKQLAERAQQLAMEKEDAIMVREKFRKAFL